MRRQIRNLTQHRITLISDGRTSVYPPYEGLPTPRVAESTRKISEIDGWPVFEVEYGQVVNLPPYEPGVAWVVSLLVCLMAPHRRDLYCPARQIRDAGGNIIGAEGLAQVPPPTGAA